MLDSEEHSIVSWRVEATLHLYDIPRLSKILVRVGFKEKVMSYSVRTHLFHTVCAYSIETNRWKQFGKLGGGIEFQQLPVVVSRWRSSTCTGIPDLQFGQSARTQSEFFRARVLGWAEFRFLFH